jgi:NADH-quinone oxidoreductase subunit F
MLPVTATEGRVLPAEPLADLDAYVARGGGRAIEGARQVEAAAVIATIADAGLRGRGGAGFPTGTKWAAVAEHRSDVLKATVVVNAAEGEPWTEKDRAILLADPYQVIEGALVAAHAVGAGEVVVALRASFGDVQARVESAIAEIDAAGWCGDVAVRTFSGPEEYLYGEETGLLEALEGRPPFPRIAPPYRRGATEVASGAAQPDDESGLSAGVALAGASDAPPALVDNVETLAHVAWIVADGPEPFRALGTAGTAGTIVCTVTGLVGGDGPADDDDRQGGIGEVPAGTTVRQAIDRIAGGIPSGTEVGAVVLGAATRPLRPEELDLPLCFDALAAAGSGLGSGTIHVVAYGDVLPTVAGISRFLAVESCGQCEPCKRDGLALADALKGLCSGEPAGEEVVVVLGERVATVADGARCALARQHEALVGGLLEHFPGEVHLRQQGRAAEVPHVGDHIPGKQPDWSYDAVWSGANPADELADHT